MDKMDNDEETMDTELDERENESTALLGDHGQRSNYASSLSRTQRRVRLTWENLNVKAPVKKSWFKKKKSGQDEEIPVLRNVSGGVESGQLLAIMGASGAGKTTLFNVLQARNVKSFNVDGRVCVNGQQIGRKITSISAYVQQNDMFLGTLTVREHLVFQALLRLPKRLTRDQKIKRVDEVIFELGLKKCSNTTIGVAGMLKGISGGEAKRLAFASEVLRNPPILFCDEPTTGLDSFMAESVIHVLQNLAAGGKAILCTIHQPPSEVYKMFDRVMFMAEGRLAYAGSAIDALEFFSQQGYACPEDYNPADFFIHTLAVSKGKDEESKERIEKICDEFKNSEFSESWSELTSSMGDEQDFMQSEELQHKSPYNASWPLQFGILLWRSLLTSFRNRRFVKAKVIQKIVLGLFIGLLYLNNTLNQNTIMNYNGALFFVLAETTFPVVFGLLTILPDEFPLLVREHHNGMYKVSSYYLAKVVSFIPTFSLDATIFISICYFMIGFRPAADAFFITLGLSLLIAQCSCAFALLLSAVSPSLPIGLAIAGPVVTIIQLTGGLYANLGTMHGVMSLLSLSLIMARCNDQGALMGSLIPGSTALIVSIMTPLETLLFMTAGYFTNLGTIPPYISWVQYISWFRYGYEGLAINQWHAIKNITCEQSTSEMSCVKDGDEVLEQLSFNPNNLSFDALYIFLLTVGFNVLGYFSLWFRAYRAR